jgi:hypothetical protein
VGSIKSWEDLEWLQNWWFFEKGCELHGVSYCTVLQNEILEVELETYKLLEAELEACKLLVKSLQDKNRGVG